MKKMIVNNDAFHPILKTVDLNEKTTIDIAYYDFTSQILCFLQNKKLVKQQNLLIDTKYPTKMYQSPDNILKESLSGSA